MHCKNELNMKKLISSIEIIETCPSVPISQTNCFEIFAVEFAAYYNNFLMGPGISLLFAEKKNCITLIQSKAQIVIHASNDIFH